MTRTSRDRALAVLMTVLVVAMLVLVYWRAYLLVRAGTAVTITLGVAVLVIATVGAWLLARSFAFGQNTQRLAHRLEAEGALPVDDLPKRPSGRPERAAADVAFDQRKAEIDTTPEDWRAWFRVAVAYDDAGDRSRAREAMREAITRERNDR